MSRRAQLDVNLITVNCPLAQDRLFWCSGFSISTDLETSINFGRNVSSFFLDEDQKLDELEEETVKKKSTKAKFGFEKKNFMSHVCG